MIFDSKKVMFEVGVYFGAVTGGQNGISGSPGVAGTYVSRTHSITFTRNDVYMTSIHTKLSPVAIYNKFNRCVSYMMAIMTHAGAKMTWMTADDSYQTVSRSDLNIMLNELFFKL